MPRLRVWLRPPRDLMVLFLLVMLVPASTLAMLGLRLHEQDKALERQRLTEQREGAADRAVMILEQAIAATEAHISNPKGLDPTEDALHVVFDFNGIEVEPPGRLLFYPVMPERREAPDRLFQQADEFEFRTQDYQAAVVRCRDLSLSSDPAIRAGALLRLARNFRKMGQRPEALDICDQLGRISSVTLGGIPADLVARRFRCAVLEELDRSADLRREAMSLDSDLRMGRWRLDLASYSFFSEQANAWLRSPGNQELVQEALAGAVETLWKRWKQTPREEFSQTGRQCLALEASAIVTLWQSTPEHLAALMAGPQYQARRWFPALAGIRGFQISLLSPEGHTVLGIPPPSTAPRTQRPASETGLPWSVLVMHVDSTPALAEFASRRRLLLAGLGVLAILVAAGSYFIWRAMARELAAAQLQSDFVAAVSHEFRTPLTSLRQFNMLLAEGEAHGNEQRREFWAAQSRATDPLQRLVESLLDFGRMEAGARPYQFEKIELGAIVESVVSDFQKEPGAAGFAIQCAVTHALVNADAEALSRALWNLLDNAVKYSGESRAIAVTMHSSADFISISVCDRGPGIPRLEQELIFGKFARGAYAREHHIRGTGIGLTMVRHIVEAHGGKITLVSAPGKGSTFTILLPAQG
jgi:signal transduction histidine kinase